MVCKHAIMSRIFGPCVFCLCNVGGVPFASRPCVRSCRVSKGSQLSNRCAVAVRSDCVGAVMGAVGTMRGL